MRPPYTITSTILNLVTEISEKLGVIRAVHPHRPPIELRKKNRIKTIQASLEIERNSVTEEQQKGKRKKRLIDIINFR